MKYLIEQISFEERGNYLDVEWNIQGYVTIKLDTGDSFSFEEEELDEFYIRVKELFKQQTKIVKDEK